MKKYLLLVCTLMIITSFVSCGETPEDNSSVSENSVSEVATEASTEPETTTQDETTEQVTEAETTQPETEETTTEPESTASETEPPTEVIPPRDNAIGASNKDIADITAVFHKKVPNDVTGKWKCLVVDAMGSIPEYALSAYNKYGADASVFIMEDLTGRQCAVVTDLGDMLDVSIHEYVDKEHEDAKLMASGNLLAEYRIYKDNGDIVTISEETAGELKNSDSETENSVSGESFVEDVKSTIQGKVGKNESITDVVYQERQLTVYVDISQADPAPLTLKDLALNRNSSITDAILKLSQYDDLWDEVIIDFGETGTVVNTKADIVYNGYGGRYFDVDMKYLDLWGMVP
ncbi:MAG: hypothetical protein K2H82_07705 [Oscillospiraceae bacterium]|nr:hypothetical protein [Oscillospiraceae bacterium]